MWVIFDGGFVSVVAHDKRPGFMLVRARCRDDLVGFLEACEQGRLGEATDKLRKSIVRTPKADYTLPSAFAALGVAWLMLRIDYPNFKGKVLEDDPSRAHVYGRVWRELLAIDPRG